jgi:hypothetical protein
MTPTQMTPLAAKHIRKLSRIIEEQAEALGLATASCDSLQLDLAFSQDLRTGINKRVDDLLKEKSYLEVKVVDLQLEVNALERAARDRVHDEAWRVDSQEVANEELRQIQEEDESLTAETPDGLPLDSPSVSRQTSAIRSLNVCDWRTDENL